MGNRVFCHVSYSHQLQTRSPEGRSSVTIVIVSADRPETFELSALYFRHLLQFSIRSVWQKKQDFDDVI